VEYQGLAEQLLTAFQQANRVPASTSTAAASAAAGDTWSTSRLDVEERFDFSGQLGSDQFDHLGPSLLISLPDAARQYSYSSRSAGGSLTSSAASSIDESPSSSGSSSMDESPSSSRSSGNVRGKLQDSVQHADSQRLQQHGPTSSSNSSNMRASQHATNQMHGSTAAAAASAQAAEQDAAAAADATFMQLLLLLAQRAAFVPLSERDVALGVSLNTDFLWQLFVKVSTEQLDGTLVPPQLVPGPAAAGAAAGAVDAAASAGQPKETDSLLVLRCAIDAYSYDCSSIGIWQVAQGACTFGEHL
jgi:hypothetical protein